MRTAEKNWLKEGEAADEEQKKLKKESERKVAASTKDGASKATAARRRSVVSQMRIDQPLLLAVEMVMPVLPLIMTTMMFNGGNSTVYPGTAEMVMLSNQ